MSLAWRFGRRSGALAERCWGRPLATACDAASGHRHPRAGVGLPRRFCSAAPQESGESGTKDAVVEGKREAQKDESSGGERRRKSPWRHLFWVFPATTFFLGCWQVQRKAWKEGLIESMASRCAAEPTPWAELPKELREDFDEQVVQEWAYKPVIAAGTFDHSKEFHLGPRVVDGQSGFHVVTAFRLDSGYDSGTELKASQSGGQGLIENDGRDTLTVIGNILVQVTMIAAMTMTVL